MDRQRGIQIHEQTGGQRDREIYKQTEEEIDMLQKLFNLQPSKMGDIRKKRENRVTTT